MLALITAVSSLAVLALVPTSTTALGFGGGGCGCAPPPPCIPQPCIQPVPVPVPQLVPGPPICLPSLPSIPTCGCCGKRKKRAAIGGPAPVNGHHPEAVAAGKAGNEQQAQPSMCNNPQMRKIILKNISDDPVQSKTAIHSELKAKMGGEWVVVCSQGAFSFVADSANFCIDGSSKQTCSAFQASPPAEQ